MSRREVRRRRARIAIWAAVAIIALIDGMTNALSFFICIAAALIVALEVREIWRKRGEG